MARAGKLTASFGIDLSRFEKDIRKIRDRLGRASREISGAGRGLTAGIALPVAAAGAAALRASIQFESAFANVKKFVTGADDALARDIRELSTEIPVTAEKISEFVAALGQLGIQRESILGIAKAMIQLEETSNLVGTDGAKSIARMANVLGLAESEMIPMASVITELGSTSKTTEAEIVAMAERITAAGRIAGLAAPDVLALASALTSTGIRAEAGGTAITRVLQEIKSAVELGGEKLEVFAEITGKSAREFATAWRDNAARAFLEFLGGLGSLEGQGARIFTVLEELDFGAIRVKAALLNSALAVGAFEKNLVDARAEMERNTALNVRTAEAWATTGAELTKARNKMTEVFRTLGDQLTPSLLELVRGLESSLLPLVQGWIKGFSELSEGARSFLIKLAALTVALGPTLVAIGALVSVLKSLAAVLVLVVKHPITSLLTALGAAAVAMGAFGADAKKTTREVSELAAEMDKLSGDALTAAQKLDAFRGLQATEGVLKNVRQELIATETALKSALNPTRKLSAELRQALGERLKDTQERLGGVDDKLQELWRGLHRVDGKTLEYNAAVEQLAALQKRAAEAAPRLAAMLDEGGREADVAARAIAAHKAILEQQVIVFGENSDAANKTRDAIAELNKIREEQIRIATETQVAEAELGATTDEVAETAIRAAGAWELWLEDMTDSAERFKELGLGAMQDFTRGVGQAVATAIVFGEDFEEGIINVFKNVAANIIAALIDIGIQMLIAQIATEALTRAAAQAFIASKSAETFAAMFASVVTALPFPANLAAPGIAAGTASALVAGAQGFAAYAEGGIVTGPQMALVGDNPSGTEAIIPIEKFGQVFGDVGGAGATHLTIEMNGRAIARAVVPHIPGEVRLRTGGRI